MRKGERKVKGPFAAVKKRHCSTGFNRYRGGVGGGYGGPEFEVTPLNFNAPIYTRWVTSHHLANSVWPSLRRPWHWPLRTCGQFWVLTISRRTRNVQNYDWRLTRCGSGEEIERMSQGFERWTANRPLTCQVQHNALKRRECHRDYKLPLNQIPFCSPIPSVLWRCWLSDQKGIGPAKSRTSNSKGVFFCRPLGDSVSTCSNLDNNRQVKQMPAKMTSQYSSTVREFHHHRWNSTIPMHQGRSDGGLSVYIYPPPKKKKSTLKNLCGCSSPVTQDRFDICWRVGH